MVNLQKCWGRGGGDSAVTDVPSGTRRGCLGSGGKPTGFSRQKAVALLVSQTYLQGRMGIWDRWIGGELFGV